MLTDGALFPLAALAIVLPLFLPIAVALNAGEAIAGEAQAGTLRYVLARPVGRTRLLVAKLVSVMAFVVLTVLVVAVTAYVVGMLLLGRDEVVGGVSTGVSGTSFSTRELLLRTLLALAYAMVCMLGVAAIAVFLSTVTRSPLGASLGSTGRPHRLDDPAHPRRGQRAPSLPADPLLAGVRGPVPRPDPVARRRTGRRPPGGVRRGVPRRRVGELHDQGRHGLALP